MPIVNMAIKKGAPENKITECMKEITNAVAGNLEKTVPRMVRVTVDEIEESQWYVGDEHPSSLHPLLTIDIGGGRSDESIDNTLKAIVNAVADSLEVSKSEISIYRIKTPDEHFTIAGKVK